MFNCISKDNFEIPNIRLIHPIKQDTVAKIYRTFKDTHCNIYIFGSSITDRCWFTSDLDIAINPYNEGNIKKILDITKGNCDIIDLSKLKQYKNKSFENSVYNGVRIL